MRVEYKTIPVSDIVSLNEYGKDRWITSILVKDIIVLYREVKKTREQKNALKTPEYLEFLKVYPSKTGIYDDKFIIKYNKLVEEGIHDKIIESVGKYVKELEVTGKPVANASTFINQKRWLQDFKVTKSKDEDWMNPLLEKLPADKITLVKARAKQWEKENSTKKLTEGVLLNIIKYYTE